MNYIDRCLNPARVLNHLEGMARKSRDMGFEPKSAGMIELQLTDACNLRCAHCHFRDLGDSVFRREWLGIVNNEIRPRAISLAGGGEPTMYPDFEGAIEILGHGKGSPSIGLITNGVTIPAGDWPSKLAWLRVSLYTVDGGRYAGRDSSVLEAVLANIERYASMRDLPIFGVSLLYYRGNVEACVDASRRLFDIARGSGRGPESFTVQFKRAFAAGDPRNLSDEALADSTDITPIAEEVESAVGHAEAMFARDREFKDFMAACSNYGQLERLTAESLGDVRNQYCPDVPVERDMKNCYVALEHRLVTPDGYVYPCPTVAENRDVSTALGHITDSDEVFAARLPEYFTCEQEWCRGRFCRHAGHNGIVEEAMRNGRAPALPGELAGDYFF